MTNEEAMKEIEDASSEVVKHWYLKDPVVAKEAERRIEAFSMATSALKAQTSGKWIKGYTYPDGEYWECDCCNTLVKVKFPMKFCNACGAKMGEVEK